VAQLRLELSRRGLPTLGLKAALQGRLDAAARSGDHGPGRSSSSSSSSNPAAAAVVAAAAPLKVVVECADMLTLDWEELAAAGRDDCGDDDNGGDEGGTDGDRRVVVVSSVPFGVTSKLLYALADGSRHIRRCVRGAERHRRRARASALDGDPHRAS
jgi:hypothetical protein